MLQGGMRRLAELVLPAGSHPPGERVHTILSRIEDAIRTEVKVDQILKLLDSSQRPLFDALSEHFHAPVVAKALTLKILNLCLAKYHFHTRSSTLISQPFGLNVDPSDACNLACPGCVHSHHVKELKLFDWDNKTLTESRLAALLDSYGPYAIHVVFCNYGEPVINPATPQLIRQTKRYLMQAMISTNLSIGRFDALAYVESGLDYAIVSIDGATQPVYEKFRRNGRLDVVFRNIRNLVEAKRALGRRTPVIAWRFLTFEHNVHEVPAAIEIARELGVDQFLTLTPYDVSWDDPAIQPAPIEPVDMLFNRDAESCVLDNWNPFPDSLQAGPIEREFEVRWRDRLKGTPPEMSDAAAGPGLTCQWLYKSVTLDGGGRIFPCCAPPRPDIDLVFDHFDGNGAAGIFNNDKYRLARLGFTDRTAYQRLMTESGSQREPHCAKCEWRKDYVNTDGRQVRQYLKAAGAALFNSGSASILADW